MAALLTQAQAWDALGVIPEPRSDSRTNTSVRVMSTAASTPAESVETGHVWIRPPSALRGRRLNGAANPTPGGAGNRPPGDRGKSGLMLANHL